MFGWSVWASHRGWHTLGDLPYKASGVILPSSVKQDGWLREHVFEYLKSVSIWSGEVSQLPFKVEISPQVLVLLCFMGVCLFCGNFHRFLAM